MSTRLRPALSIAFATGLSAFAGTALAQLATPLGAELAIDTASATGRQRAPRVVATPTGGFLVVWAAEGSAGGDADGFGVQLARLDGDGVPLAAQASLNTGTTAGDQIPGGVAGLAAGGHIVVWESGVGTPASAVRLRRLDADGAPLAAELDLGTGGAGTERAPAVAGLAGGGFVVAWTGEGSGAADDDAGIEARRFADDGSALGAVLQVNSYTTSFQRDARVSGRADGGFTVAWLSDRATPARGFAATNAVARRFGSAAQPLEAERIVSLDPGDGVGAPRLAVAPGAELVLWEDERNLLDVGLRGRWSDANGIALGAEIEPTTADVDDSAVARSPTGTTFALAFSRREPAERGRVEVEPIAAGGYPGAARLTVDGDDGWRPDRVDLAFLAEDRFVTVWDERAADDGSWRIRGRLLGLLPILFGDDFESGDLTRWSSATP